jgi:hypothetical protein
MFKRFAAILAVGLALWSHGIGQSQAGMVFNLVDIGGAGVGSQARTGFQTAADFWSSKFNDDIVINLNVGMANLGGSTLGGADLELVQTSYSNFRTFALADATTSDDATFTTNLPTGPSFSLYINRTSNNPNGPQSATPYLDNDGDANNTTVLLARANAKALGLLNPNDLGLDAEIQFSTAFTFDYDRTNGIASNAFDFIGIAIHEIGHALGFFSGVDILDNPAANGLRDDQFTAVTPLDFSRFSAASQSAGADLDWTVDARSKYFSVNGGTTIDVDNAWSLGRNFGDGRQASHWKDNLGRGIMDPTFAPGELGSVTNLDLQAFDIIGFNSTAVPEPASVAIFASGLTLLGIFRRKTKKSA